MPQPLNEDAVQTLNDLIEEHDELVSTRYTWEGDYAYVTITLRRRVPSPSQIRA